MKIALISDIHSNLPALEAVLKSIREEAAEFVLCLGDIVGYGASPNECVELLIREKIPCLLGNHDEVAVGDGDINSFNSFARTAAEWTRHRLTPENAQFLKSLPLIREKENLFLAHASPFEPEKWHYLFNASEARISFDHFTQPVAFIGHTHIPMVFMNPTNNCRIINVGSVGQPRDRDHRACYGMFRTDTAHFQWMRVDYPIRRAAEMIANAGLPKFLAERLHGGI